MKHLITLLVALFIATPVFADNDTTTSTSTSTSTASSGIATAIGGTGGVGGSGGLGGSGGTGGSGGYATGGTGVGYGVGGASDSASSNEGNSMSVDAQSHQVKQYRIAPAVSLGAASGVDGIGMTTPFGGAMYNKGNRFQQAMALYNLKAANGMDCSREIAIMERETEETKFLWLLPMDSPFGIGQTKPLFREKTEAEPVHRRDPETGLYPLTKNKGVNGNAGVLVNGTQA